ncbi:hypothetical protein BaRGS_00015468 [Batillaria attramentaria]|uniref:Fibronectin type-III domain-containing protein n=1 Tax=Batillaria attramentaria TaxID=370345 RepID=A0ABD0L1S7_9CAEN
METVTQDLIQNTVEIVDTAHSYRLQLSQLLDTLTELEDQVCSSGSRAVKMLTAHFAGLKAAVCEALDARLHQLVEEIECMKETALTPLHECRALIGKSVETASQVMEEGRTIMAADPESNLDRILKFRDNPMTKSLASVPELPSPSEVAYFTIETNPDLREQLRELIAEEGKVMSHPPVQILHADEKPGGVQVHWSETEEDSDLTEFMLQYARGKPASNDDSRLLFHTAYEGPSTSFTVRNLRTNTPYSFRVRGRVDRNSAWSPWSLPLVKSTSIPHHQWSDAGEEYSLSNEGRTATRTGEGLTCVLYSATNSYAAGDALNLHILDSADVSPGDGLAIVCNNCDDNSCNRPGAIFVNTYGNVFVDGQEMKTKLPPIRKGTTLTFQTEMLPNGKVRVSVQVDDKEVTLDWKVSSQAGVNVGLMQNESVPSFFFALRFAQEHWKIGVE